MRKNKIISISISLILILTLLLGLATVPVLGATSEIVVYDGSTSLGVMLVDSIQNLYVVWENSTDADSLMISNSSDDGVTWVTNDVGSFGNEGESFYGAVIDSQNVIHIVTGYSSGTNVYYYHYSYAISNSTLSSSYELVHWVLGLVGSKGATITVDKNDNVYVFYTYVDHTSPTYKTRVYMSIRNDEGSWSGSTLAWSESPTGGTILKGLSADTDSLGDVFCSFIREKGEAGYINELWCIKFDVSETSFSSVEPLGANILNYQAWSDEGSMTDLVIDSSDNIHIAFQVEDISGDAFIRYTYSTDYSTWYNETIYYYNLHDNEDCSISYSSDGSVSILWVGEDVFYSDRHVVLGVTGSFGDWSSRSYYAVDASDDFYGTKQPYQNYPSFTELNSGLVGCSRNSTSSVTMFFYEGDMTFLGSGGSGQDEGSVGDSDYSRCSAGSGNNINIYAPYIESFLTSFGDVTIGAVDLFVSVDQYNTVNSDKSKYFAFLNGVSIGNPSYFFQDSSTGYVLRWLFSGIDIGFYNVVLEFGMTGSSGAPYGAQWMNLPTNIYNIQGSTYHDNISNFGDGIRQGYYFSTSNYDLGTKYCLYYNLNVPVDSNIYNLTLFSVDPHLQGNTTSISVDVTGDNDWWAILRSPSDSVVFFETHFGGDNGDAVYQHTFSPDAEIGEWKFYALDRGYYSYPFGGLDDYGTNISLNVSDGSSSFGDWEVFPYEAIVPLNTWTGFNVIAPLGQEFTVRVYHPSESSYEDYVGIGEGSTLIYSGPFIDCDTEGTWTLMLFNTTGSVSYNMDIKQFVVDSGTLQNSLTILGPNDICIGGYITFKGNYLDSIGSIEVILDSEHSYSIGLSLGSFIRHFTIPMDAEGDWVAYLADSSGNIISGTTVSFISINCDAEVPPDDDDTDDDASAWADEIVPNEFNPYVGAIIVGIFMCIPFGLSAQTGMEFPMIGYGFFGMLGLGLSTSLGFFDTWIIYTLVVTIIGVAVIVIFIKR